MDESDEEDDTGSGYTNEIDLDNGQLSLRDKWDIVQTRIADRFRNFNQKDLNVALKGKKSTPRETVKHIAEKTKNVNWQGMTSKILSHSHHQNIHRYFQYSLVISVTVISANLVGEFINGTKEYDIRSSSKVVIDDSTLLTADSINSIRDANVFRTDSVEIIKDPTAGQDQNKVCRKADKKSNLPIELINTIVLQDSVKSLASVSIRSKSDLMNFREGDKINNLAQIGSIVRQKLIVKNLSTGDCESIESKVSDKNRPKRSSPISVLSPSASKNYKTQLKKIEGIETDGSNFKIKKEFLEDKLKDINSLLTQARGVKINNPDGTMSFKIVDIEPGSIYAYLGIQDGDIISQINGEPIKNLNEVMSLFGRVSNLKTLNLTMSRGSDDVSQNYVIE